MEVGKVFSSLMQEVDALKNAIEKATDSRQNFINQQAEEIANMGLVKRLFGGAPPPIPDVDKVPLTREAITKYIPPELLASDSLQRLLTAQQSNTTIVLGENDGVLKEVVNSTLGLGEASAVTVHNAAWDMTAAAGALGYGLLQFTKEGNIEDATRVAKESYKLFKEQSHHEMSSNAKKTVDENYVLQGASYALEKTVVPVIEVLNETLPEPVVVFGGLFLSSIPSGKSAIKTGKMTELLSSRHYFEELTKVGIKFTPENVIRIDKMPDGKIVFLEKGKGGTRGAGLEHIIERHGKEFENIGVKATEIPDVIMDFLTKGEAVSHQGKGLSRPIYEHVINGEKHRLAITVSDNGFIVGANPAGSVK